MTFQRNNVIKYFYLLIIVLLFIIGFLIRENIAGAAETDFLKFTWPAVLSFKRDFAYSIINYGKFGEGSTPLFHILNAYLNPFTFSQIAFQASITLISIISFLVLADILVEKFKIKKIDALIYSSILLLLPFYRASAFWGLTENLGWLFLILSLKFYVKFEASKNKNEKTYIFLICLFSSMALYTRPYLIFFPVFLILTFILNKDYKSLVQFSFTYLLFSLPGLFLLNLWGGTVYLGIGDNKIDFIQDYHHPKFILKNLIIFPTIFLFYFLPFKLIEFFNKQFYFTKNKILLFFYFFIFLLISLFYYLDFFEYLKLTKLGGGSVLKISQFFFQENLIIFLLISFLGIVTIIELAILSKKNLILLLSIVTIYCTPKFIYQEYFEPLLILLFFLLFDLRVNLKKTFQDNKFQILLLVYFLGYFVSSYYYRYYLEAI